jgi:hypothetical protein
LNKDCKVGDSRQNSPEGNLFPFHLVVLIESTASLAAFIFGQFGRRCRIEAVCTPYFIPVSRISTLSGILAASNRSYSAPFLPGNKRSTWRHPFHVEHSATTETLVAAKQGSASPSRSCLPGYSSRFLWQRTYTPKLIRGCRLQSHFATWRGSLGTGFPQEKGPQSPHLVESEVLLFKSGHIPLSGEPFWDSPPFNVQSICNHLE